MRYPFSAMRSFFQLEELRNKDVYQAKIGVIYCGFMDFLKIKF